MGDDPVTVVQEEQHLGVPVVSREGPTVAEHDRLTRAPILVVNLCAVGDGDDPHATSSSHTSSKFVVSFHSRSHGIHVSDRSGHLRADVPEYSQCPTKAS